MTTKMRRRHKQKRQKSKAKKTKNPAPRYVIASILGLATVLGGFAAIVTFMPRLSVSAGIPVDPENPFSSSFTIRNTGAIPLDDVSACVGVGQIEGKGANPLRIVPDFKSQACPSVWKGHHLPIDGAFTVTTSDVFGMTPGSTLEFADVAIVVTYRPWFVPFHEEEIFRFITHQQTNGKLYWYDQTLEKPSD